MQISTRGRYGLKAMVDLAIFSVDEYVALNNLAERQNNSSICSIDDSITLDTNVSYINYYIFL
jgi:hypothetical protein